MKKTHYETFIESIASQRPAARRLLAVQEEVAPDKEEFWFTLLYEMGGVKTKDGKFLPFVLRGQKMSREQGKLVGAYLFEYNCRRFKENNLSLSRTRMTDYCFAAHIGSLASYMHREQAQSGAEVAYQILNHEISGKKVYDVSPGLAEKLRDTELRGLHCSDVRLPYKNIYIQVPDNLDFEIYNVDTGMHKVVGIYITEDPDSKREAKGITKYFADTEKKCVTTVEGKSYEELETVRDWSIIVIGGPGKDKDGKDIENDDALFFYRLYFFDSTLEEAIAELSQRNDSDCPDGRAKKIVNAMENRWQQIFRWALNVIMYATYSDPGEKIIGNKEARQLWQRIEKCPPGKKRRALMEKSKSTPRQDRIMLGRNIPVYREVRKTGKLGPISIRVKVSGHWRNVRCGKGYKERRWKFVEPFWRGPELGEIVSRKHVLK